MRVLSDSYNEQYFIYMNTYYILYSVFIKYPAKIISEEYKPIGTYINLF